MGFSFFPVRLTWCLFGVAGAFDAALVRAANRVTDAHLEAFARDGAVPLRRLVDGDATAGAIACRLLGARRVRFARPGDDDTATVLGGGTPGRLTVAGFRSFDLGPRDALVLRQAFDGGLAFAACDDDDVDCLFEDPFYGRRGRTPVTVAQWSKGLAVDEERIDR